MGTGVGLLGAGRASALDEQPTIATSESVRPREPRREDMGALLGETAGKRKFLPEDVSDPNPQARVENGEDPSSQKIRVTSQSLPPRWIAILVGRWDG
jgi:hypothetical protein